MTDRQWINRIYRVLPSGVEECKGGYVNVTEADYWCNRFQEEEHKRNPGSGAVYETRREVRIPKEHQ